MKRWIITCFAFLISATPARAADATQPPAFNWTGFYVGGHVGYAWGGGDWAAPSAADSQQGSLDFFQPYDLSKGTGSYFIGLQSGYNYRLPSGWVVGAQVDMVAPNTIAADTKLSSPASGLASVTDTVELSGTVRGRLGFLHNNWLVYGTAGYAWSYDEFSHNQLIAVPLSTTAAPFEKASAWRNGYAIGAGVETLVAPNWTANVEYLFTAFGTASVNFPLAGQHFEASQNLQSLRVGLNYQYGEKATDAQIVAPKSDRWAVHGQSTGVYQYAFPFREPYHGTNSLDANHGRETWDVTFYLGAKLWRGAELWVNPEIDQGSGLSGTVGVAGFPNGEAYKLGSIYPYARLPRTFFRQTINLGGATEKVEAGPNQFEGSRSADRLVFTAGKFAVTDIFDTNKYAHDPRVDFLNWAIVDTGSFDYAADAWGYTYGAAVEWYQGPWTFRGGLFDLSIVPNSTRLDPTFTQHQWIGEIERRYKLADQPGKLAVTGFITQGRMGRFDEAINLANLTGTAADIAAVRRTQSRTGISFNLEQQINADLGFFARGGISDGRLETFEFTDIDQTVAAGLVLTGASWGRPNDTVGLAGIVNGISRRHEEFLNAGGLGILVGDGKLPHPGSEKIVETYYAFPIGPLRASVNYQIVDNPAYNQDRGPVSVIGTRLRYQF